MSPMKPNTKNNRHKITKAISGPRARAYFRDLFAAEDGLTKDGAGRLAETVEREIAQVRVRLPIPDRKPAAAGTGERGAKAHAAHSKPEAVPFDPFAFSVVVVLTKDGKDGLTKRLESIASAEHLRAIAKAQHIPVDPSLDAPAGIIAAIVSGTEQRIADRRAAAS